MDDTSLFEQRQQLRCSPEANSSGRPNGVAAGQTPNPAVRTADEQEDQGRCSTVRTPRYEQATPGELAVVRATLVTLVQLVGELPDQAAHGRQAYHEHSGLLGGDATVMLAPQSGAWAVDHLQPVTAEPGDPRPPLDVLTYWSRAISRETDTAVGLFGTVEHAADRLDAQLTDAARLSLFPRMVRDLARLLHSVENVVHAGDRPDVSRVPCLDCGTRLHRVWTKAEHDDYWRCPKCGQVYDQGRYDRAQHDQLASRGAERFVPLTDAVAATGRPEQTIRGWARDGLVRSRRTPGRPREVWWPDVRERHQDTPTRKRGKS